MDMEDKNKSSIKLIATNHKANYEYFLSDFLEVGIQLCGTEIKSLRLGHCSLTEAYIGFYKEEAYIYNMDIPVYEFGNIFNHEPKRDRKLLLHKSEILKLANSCKLKGYTVVPVKCYLKNGKAKLQIALGKGKTNYDKREVIKNRDIDRKIQKEYKRGY